MPKVGHVPAVAECSKSGIRHTRPVGVRCRRDLNVSAPVAEADQSSIRVNFQDHPSTSQPNKLSSLLSPQIWPIIWGLVFGFHSLSQSQMETKLDLILKKMDQLEAKNSELEKKFHKQSTIRPASKLSHSSLKRSHRCSTSCSSANPKKMKAPSASEATGLETSAEFLDGSSISDSYAQESQSRNSEASNDHVSVDCLK